MCTDKKPRCRKGLRFAIYTSGLSLNITTLQGSLMAAAIGKDPKGTEAENSNWGKYHPDWSYQNKSIHCRRDTETILAPDNIHQSKLFSMWEIVIWLEQNKFDAPLITTGAYRRTASFFHQLLHYNGQLLFSHTAPSLTIFKNFIICKRYNYNCPYVKKKYLRYTNVNLSV